MPFLDWVNKNQAVQASNQVPYHLLQHQNTYGDAAAARENLLIQGDNLQALKALLPFYTGKSNVSLSTRRTTPNRRLSTMMTNSNTRNG